jgi:hypothetical protein
MMGYSHAKSMYALLKRKKESRVIGIVGHGAFSKSCPFVVEFVRKPRVPR